jgi:hypothetical protein
VTESFPKEGLPYPITVPGVQAAVNEALVAVELAKIRLAEAEAKLHDALVKRNAFYICRCCGEKSLTPLGLYDYNQCAICWNGIHGKPTCTTNTQHWNDP